MKQSHSVTLPRSPLSNYHLTAVQISRSTSPHSRPRAHSRLAQKILTVCR
jgi:hypothetical protein